VREYDIFVPLYYNDGAPIEAEKFQLLQPTLLDEFEGLTFFPQPNTGFWKMANVTYRDEIVSAALLPPPPKGRDLSWELSKNG
jgi:hypothetical protein